MRLAWVTDIHLNFCSAAEVAAFSTGLLAERPDAVLVSGDISEAPDVERHLLDFERQVARPIYFVLGNHDYYGGSIARVREAMQDLSRRTGGLTWLGGTRAVALTARTGLVGHDGWNDGRLGDYARSGVRLNDYRLIEELSGLDHRTERLHRLQALGDEAAAHIREVLPPALDRHERVLLLTHVPPYRETCWHESRTPDPDNEYLPHFSCRAMGDTLTALMAARPDRELLVLCGHTHGEGETRILPNLRVLTGGAVYGSPRLARLIEID